MEPPPTSQLSTVKEPSIPKKIRKRKEAMTTFETSFLELAKSQSEALAEPQDPMQAFFESCALRSKDLSSKKKSWLQVQVSMLLHTIETSEHLPPSQQPTYQQIQPQQPLQQPMSHLMQPIYNNLQTSHHLSGNPLVNANESNQSPAFHEILGSAMDTMHRFT